MFSTTDEFNNIPRDDSKRLFSLYIEVQFSAVARIPQMTGSFL
jgi:hypothetical protein